MGIYDALYAQCLATLRAHLRDETGDDAQPVSTTVDYLSQSEFDLANVRFTPKIDRTTRTMVFAQTLAKNSNGNLMRITAIFHRS